MANTNERKAQVTYNGDGTQKVFSFPFDYLRKAFVKVKTIGTSTTTNLTQGVDYTVSDKTIDFVVAPSSLFMIYRETSTDRMVSWSDASVLTANDMTLQEVQLLHIAEEVLDKVQDNGMAIDETDSSWDARYARIKNLLDPANPGDAVTLRFITANKDALLNALKTQAEAEKEAIKTAGTTWETTINQHGTEQTQRIETTANTYVGNMTILKDETTTQASVAATQANLSKAWAVADGSPDSSADTSSPTGKTQSSKTWALYAKDRATAANTASTNAKTSETNAATSATGANNAKTAAETAANNAATSATNASNSSSTASSSAAQALTHKTEAATSATNAANSATEAAKSAQEAKEVAAELAGSIGNPVTSVTEDGGIVTVTKLDSTKNTFTTGQPTDLVGLTGSNATLTLTKRNGETGSITINNVESATKAVQDGNGNNIAETYLSKTAADFSNFVQKGGMNLFNALNSVTASQIPTEATATDEEWLQLGLFSCEFTSDMNFAHKPTAMGQLINIPSPTNRKVLQLWFGSSTDEFGLYYRMSGVTAPVSSMEFTPIGSGGGEPGIIPGGMIWLE